MTKSAVKAYGKVYLIFYINIPKTDDGLYRQHTDFESTDSGIVNHLAGGVCVCVCVCVYIYTAPPLLK